MAIHLTLRQIHVLNAVARQLSYTRAAEELHLSQPAVSMQVRQLEGNVGLPLLEQLGKRIYLTDAGKEMHRYGQAVAQLLGEAEQVMEEMKGVEGGRLKLAVASTVNYFATRLLGCFCKRFPSIQVSLEVTNREQLLRLLDTNRTDIVLMGEPPEGLDLIAEPFMDNPLAIIAAPDHRLTQRRGLTLLDLQSEPFLLRERGSGTRIAMERFFNEHGVALSSGMEMNANEAIKQGVEAGLGLGIVSIHTVGMELEAGRLRVLDVESFPILRKWYVVHRKGKRLSSVAQVFRDYVLKESPRLVKDLNAPP